MDSDLFFPITNTAVVRVEQVGTVGLGMCWGCP